MAKFWLLSAALALGAFSARVAEAQEDAILEDAAEGEAAADDDDNAVDDEDAKADGHVMPCAGEACPATVVDSIFYGYGTACSGLDWRFLRAVALAESGLDPKNRTGKYVGLFQLDKDACGDNLKPYKSFLSCGDLEDPEVNTAAAADRFDRYFRGRGAYPSILKSCPANTPAENMALAYVGHNNGPAVLRSVLKRGACKNAAIRKAIAAFYENHRMSRDDGKFLNKNGQLVTCNARYQERYGIIGTKALRCVNAKWGLAKYEYGRRRVASVKGIERLYVPSVKGRTLECPAVTGKRLFSPQAIAASIKNGSFKDKPIVDQAVAQRQDDRRREAAKRGAHAYASAEEAAAGWWTSETDGLISVSTISKKRGGASEKAERPGSHVPARFTPASAPPPEPERRLAADEEKDAKVDGGEPKKVKELGFWGFLKKLFGFF